MKRYESPEVVEMGSVCEAILTEKLPPHGDCVLGPTFPHILYSVVDVDE